MRLSRKELIYALVPPREHRKDNTPRKMKNWGIIILARHRNECQCDFCVEAIKQLEKAGSKVAKQNPQPD